MGSWGKKVARIAGKYGPMIGAGIATGLTGGAASPLLLASLGIGGSALSALGGSGSQGKIKTSQNNQFEQLGSQDSTTISDSQTESVQDINQFNETVETAGDKQFREGLMSQYGNEMNKAQRPIYGDATKAGFLNNLNDLSSAAMSSMRANLSASGAGDSGRLAAGIGDIELGKFGQYSKFLSELPEKEELARRGQVNTLMGLGGQLASLAPRSQRITGRTTGSSKTTGTSKTSGTYKQGGTSSSTGVQDTQGPGFWRNFIDNLGGFLTSGGFNGYQAPQQTLGSGSIFLPGGIAAPRRPRL